MSYLPPPPTGTPPSEKEESRLLQFVIGNECEASHINKNKREILRVAQNDITFWQSFLHFDTFTFAVLNITIKELVYIWKEELQWTNFDTSLKWL